MYAEALNEVNQGPTSAAYDAINEVRNRAGLPDLESGMGYEAFKTAVFNERRHELATEMKAYFDGLRFWERFEEVVESNSGAPEGYNTMPSVKIDLKEPKNRLFPIPQDVLDRNSELGQNEGW